MKLPTTIDFWNWVAAIIANTIDLLPLVSSGQMLVCPLATSTSKRCSQGLTEIVGLIAVRSISIVDKDVRVVQMLGFVHELRLLTRGARKTSATLTVSSRRQLPPTYPGVGTSKRGPKMPFVDTGQLNRRTPPPRPRSIVSGRRRRR